MQIGIMTSIIDYEKNFATMAENGIFSCQLSADGIHGESESYPDAAAVKKAAKAYGIRITALVPAWSGPRDYGYPNMYRTLGLCCPEELYETRIRDYLIAGRYAAAIEAPEIMSHFGYMPDDPNDPVHIRVADGIRRIAKEYESLGLVLGMETGEMIPLTLNLLLDEIGQANIGVNFDPANYLINGRAYPTDAAETLLPRLVSMHIKDAVKPLPGSPKGKEVPVGQGRADFPALLSMICGYGHTFDLTIEREISGPAQLTDILHAKRYIEEILRNIAAAR